MNPETAKQLSPFKRIIVVSLHTWPACIFLKYISKRSLSYFSRNTQFVIAKCLAGYHITSSIIILFSSRLVFFISNTVKEADKSIIPESNEKQRCGGYSHT